MIIGNSNGIEFPDGIFALQDATGILPRHSGASFDLSPHDLRILTAACGADIEKFCKGVKPGGGRIDACLAKNSGVSAGCRQTYAAALASLQKRAQAQEAVRQVCRADAARLCSNFREGQARILRCLIRSENVRRVTNRCNQAITDAGWR